MINGFYIKLLRTDARQWFLYLLACWFSHYIKVPSKSLLNLSYWIVQEKVSHKCVTCFSTMLWATSWPWKLLNIRKPITINQVIIMKVLGAFLLYITYIVGMAVAPEVGQVVCKWKVISEVSLDIEPQSYILSACMNDWALKCHGMPWIGNDVSHLMSMLTPCMAAVAIMNVDVNMAGPAQHSE